MSQRGILLGMILALVSGAGVVVSQAPPPPPWDVTIEGLDDIVIPDTATF